MNVFIEMITDKVSNLIAPYIMLFTLSLMAGEVVSGLVNTTVWILRAFELCLMQQNFLFCLHANIAVVIVFLL